MNPIGLAILVLFSLFLLFKLEIFKWFNEWVTLYVVLIMIWLSENWIWLLCWTVWVFLWLYLILNAERRF